MRGEIDSSGSLSVTRFVFFANLLERMITGTDFAGIVVVAAELPPMTGGEGSVKTGSQREFDGLLGW